MALPERPYGVGEPLSDSGNIVFRLNNEPPTTLELMQLDKSTHVIGKDLVLEKGAAMSIQRALNNKTQVLLLIERRKHNKLRCLFPQTDQKQGLYVIRYKDEDEAVRITDVFLTGVEKKVEEFALDYLSKGREGWDIPHTKAVVYYVNEIAKAEGLDEKTLKSAGLLHDVGYYGLFKDGDSRKLDGVMDKKARHMIVGGLLAEEILNRSEIKPFYTSEQIKTIIHLVSVHDKIEELKTPYEIALMEADTLGAIDIDRVATTFNYPDAIKYKNTELFGRRLPKFKSQAGINYFNQLLPRFVGQFDIFSTRE